MSFLADLAIPLVILASGDAAEVLEPGFAAVLEKRVAATCPAVKQQPAAGLSLTWGREAPTAELLRRLPSATDGKQFYVLWLKDRYGYNIAKVNSAYGLEAASFTDLAESNFRTLDRGREAVRKDDAEFAIDLAEALRQRVEEMFQASCGKGRPVRWQATSAQP